MIPRGKLNRTSRLGVISNCVVFSAPFLITIDRGNSVAFLLPGIYLTYVGLEKNSKKLTLFGIIWSVLVRPQAIVIALVLLFARRYRDFFTTIFFVLVSNIFLFIVWDSRHVITNVKGFISQVTAFSDRSISPDWPYNYSLTRGIYSIVKVTGIIPNIDNHQHLISMFLANGIICLTVILAFFNSRNNTSNTFLLLLPLIFLFPTTSFSYYSVIILMLLGYSIYKNLDIKSIGMGNKLLGYYTVGVWLLTLTPANLPIYGPQRLNVIQVLIAPLWAMWLIFVLAWNLVEILRRIRNPKSSDADPMRFTLKSDRNNPVAAKRKRNELKDHRPRRGTRFSPLGVN
jgi:hypothetical protein